MSYKSLRQQLNELEIELQTVTDPYQIRTLKERIQDLQFSILKYGDNGNNDYVDSNY